MAQSADETSRSSSCLSCTEAILARLWRSSSSSSMVSTIFPTARAVIRKPQLPFLLSQSLDSGELTISRALGSTRILRWASRLYRGARAYAAVCIARRKGDTNQSLHSN
eukprot:CAMPEP_0115731466 /NCGR_PEP_ID=MMETSP0272-20121206/84599_1 /TAXON_ID=71861 /ORGANISM="Scrippsiella trochoidea, Strain CCMP3099" /LENGTH=108 /DNA_ID=CAMNT_0003175303 /DNA_START=88 /DNA_END=411 /DNA_ORIENTATION=+